jgi:hypothetical protein
MLAYRESDSTTNVSGTSAASVDVDIPLRTQEGDLLIAFTNGPIGTHTAEAGWELLGSFVDGTATQSNLYRKFASSETGTYTFGFPSSSACAAAVLRYSGAHDILLWDAVTVGTTSTPVARTTDAARDSISLMVLTWSDTVTATVTSNQGAEVFDVAAANTGSTLWRGMAAYQFGAESDIVNIGDFMPGTTFTLSGAPTGGVAWQMLIGDKQPDDELWSATDGDFGVDLKLDSVAVDSTGSVATVFANDITSEVVAFSESTETLPDNATEKLVDGLASTSWLTSAIGAGWAQYDFGSGNPKTVKRYRLTAGNVFDERDPFSWTVKGSNNGTDFTVIDTRTAEGFFRRGEVREFRITSPGSYRYYRLDISVANGGSGFFIQIAEWRVSSSDVWEDVTSYVQEEAKIRITRGVQGSSGRSDFSRAYVTLDNTDGRFSLHNLNGAYAGSLQRNTEMRIYKAFGTKTLQLQGDVQLEGTDMCGDGCRTILTDTLQITGDLDVRIDLEPESWRDEQMLAGVAVAESADEAWALFMSNDGVLHLTWHDGTTFYDVSSEFAIPQASRQAIRVTLDVNNGASGHDLSFYTSDTIAGEWTKLGSTITGTGTTAIAYTGGALCVGHVGSRSKRGIHGSVYGFELRDGIGGALVADIDFTALANGSRSWEENSNFWVAVNNAVVSNRHYRFHGEIPEWPLYWDPTGNWVEVSATGAGVQRRLERSTSEQSAMRRHHTKGVISDPGAFERLAEPDAYWPMEDGEGAFQVSSGLPGKPAMQISGGTPVFATFSDFRESAALPKLGNAKFGGRVAGNAVGYADIRWIMHTPSAITANANILTLYTSGTIAQFELDYTASNTWRLRGKDENDAGTFAWDTGAISVTTVGEYLHCQLILDQSGSDVLASLRVYNRFGELVGTDDDTMVGGTLGRVYRVNVNDDDAVKMDEVYIGHLAVYGTDSPSLTAPLNAHHYETAGERVKRLCAEEGIEFRYTGALSDSAFMGYQEATSPFPLMSSSAVSEDGFLVDPLDAFGIEFRTLRSMFNQVAHFTLSYTGNELSGELRPVADDSYLTNDYTASRGDAGSARFRLDTGALSVNPPPAGVGEYSDSQSYSLAHEGQCVDLASWNVHKGTLDEARYPRVEVALENLRIAADSALAERILRLDIGKRIDITDTPDFLAHEDIRQVVIGYEEWFDNFQHNLKLNTVPERWYEVAEYDADYRFDAHDSALYQDITSSATSFSVATTTGPELSSEAKATPYEINVNGEVMRVDQVSSMAVVSNAFFDSDVTGWTSESSTLTHSTAVVHPNPVAAGSMLITPVGGVATVGAVSTHTPVGSVVPQNEYTVSFWAYSPDGWANVQTGISWYTSADALISTSSGSATSVPAGQWTFLEETFTAPATASRAGVRARLGSTPTSGDTLYVWAVRCQPEPSFEGSDKGDSFNRTDSTTTPGSTDRGTVEAWTEDLGAWGINSNAAYISAAANSYMTLTGTADFEELAVTMSTWASGEGWLNFRYTDGSNRLRFGGTVATAAVLTVISGGVSTRTVTADDDHFTLAAGDRLSVRCTGSVIECFVNGALAICVTETTQQSATRIGLQTATTAPRFNDFYFNSATSPQTVQVTRGRNGVSVPHAGESPVVLYRSPYRGV